MSEREQIVAWLRTLATAFPTPPVLAFIGDPFGDDGAKLCGDLADIIERGDHILDLPQPPSIEE